ncbi:MAG: ABC transporter ATP-binding protein [Bacteroidia bacterium]|jgi:ABC-2 type transport system ATP-binding protein
MVKDTVALHVENLSFTYPGQVSQSLKDINLRIDQGEKFGLLGPNGAGKTTLMSILTGVLPVQKGRVKLFGTEIKKNDKSLNKLFGFVPQDFSLYPELSPKENLEFFGAWAGLSGNEVKRRTNELLEIIGLTDVKNKPVTTFSGGMKRRVNLAIGVIHRPRILFLDEPTVGVDVQSRHAILAYLKELNEQGTTLIYTSHQLNEAELLCDRIAMIDEGQIIVNDELKHLLSVHNENGLEGLFLKLTGKSFRD